MPRKIKHSRQKEYITCCRKQIRNTIKEAKQKNMICKCMYQYVITFTSVLVYFCVIFSDISEEDKSDTMLPAVEVKEAK